MILVLMLYVAGPNFRYRCDGRGVRTCKSDGALGDDPLLEVLKSGVFHLVVTEVVPVSGGADKERVVGGTVNFSPTEKRMCLLISVPRQKASRQK